jgi:hypothetical protein
VFPKREIEKRRRALKRKGGFFMKKNHLITAMLVSLLALGLAFVSCDNGTSPGGGGGDEANTFTLTNISNAQLNEATALCYVGLFGSDKTKADIESDIGALINNATPTHITAGREVIENLTAPATIRGTLFSASSGFSKEWSGSGTYHIWLGLYDGSSITVYRTNNPVTLTAGGSISLDAQTDFFKPDETSAQVGTFRIKITGIPSNLMTAYGNQIGLYPANTTNYSSTNALGGRDTAVPSSDDNAGLDWYEFSIYTWTIGTIYVGPAGNYDIGFVSPSTSTSKVLKNKRLEVNQLNTVSYSDFQDP